MQPDYVNRLFKFVCLCFKKTDKAASQNNKKLILL
jgi:hypothetical protein